MHVSQPRIEVLPGSQLYINDSTVQLAGGSMWMQHMWLSVAMTPRENLAYWNWFHFQLSNGWNLEITYFRFEDGRPTPYPNGNLFSPTGDENYHFKLDAITFREYGPWRSPKTGIVYNIRHDITVEIPGHRVGSPCRGLGVNTFSFDWLLGRACVCGPFVALIPFLFSFKRTFAVPMLLTWPDHVVTMASLRPCACPNIDGPPFLHCFSRHFRSVPVLPSALVGIPTDPGQHQAPD